MRKKEVREKRDTRVPLDESPQRRLLRALLVRAEELGGLRGARREKTVQMQLLLESLLRFG